MQAPTPDDQLQQLIDAIAAHGSVSAASRALGISRNTANSRRDAAARRGIVPRVQELVGGEQAAPAEGYGVSKVTTAFDANGDVLKQWVGISVKDAKSRDMESAPLDAPLPAGHMAKGYSTLYDGNGRITAQWIKTNAVLENQLKVTIEAIRETFKDAPKVETIQAPEIADAKLLTVIPIGDQHHGMRAFHEEVGSDYDIKISANLLTSAARHLVATSPASKTCLIVNVGDFFHVDNLKNETSRSGHTLDVDTRYGLMIRSGIAMLRAFIDAALAKHQIVKVINACGNHDDIGALWLSTALGLLYEKNERVVIEQSPSKFHYHQHGKVLIGVTHGDTLKIDRLGGVMATDMPEAWGKTQHRYWLTGHIHHRKVLEMPGCMVESFRTLAGRDAWANAAAYRSGRDMMGIVFHENFGEVARHRFDVSMLE